VIPDAAVEAAARAMAPAVWGPSVWQFAAHGETATDARDRVQQQALKDARAALEAAAPHMAEYRQNEIQAEVLIHAMSVISQALATAEKWRYDRVCSDFQEMIDAAQAGKLRKS